MEETAEGEIRFVHNGNQLKEYPKGHFTKVRYITEVNNAILVCTTEGLLTFSSEFKQPEDICFYRNLRHPDEVSSLSSNDVTYVYTDSRNITYILTFTGGINKVLSENLLSEHIEFKPYTTKDGLPSDLVQSMIEDKEGSLWVISENALTRFNPEKETFEYYDKKYMQQELYFTEAAPVLENNQLLLGTDIGILKISPEHLQKSNYAPPIVFTGFKIQGTSQDLDINDLEELRLKPSERNVTFQFAALDYVAPESISYAYRLKGLEENGMKWITAVQPAISTFLRENMNCKYVLPTATEYGWKSTYPAYNCTSNLLGDILGMDSVCRIIRVIHSNYRLYHSLHIPVTSSDKY